MDGGGSGSRGEEVISSGEKGDIRRDGKKYEFCLVRGMHGIRGRQQKLHIQENVGGYERSGYTQEQNREKGKAFLREVGRDRTLVGGKGSKEGSRRMMVVECMEESREIGNLL